MQQLEQFTPPPARRRVITAEEEGHDGDGAEDDFYFYEDIIPGPPPVETVQPTGFVASLLHNVKSKHRRVYSTESLNTLGSNAAAEKNSLGSSKRTSGDELDISFTQHLLKGKGLLASKIDLEIDPLEFAAGCNLLQYAALGDLAAMEQLLQERPRHVNFRDYDRRTALHVAASEGHLHICQYLIEKKRCRVNRSDRWGGSPLDDAHRHLQADVVKYLRERGAVTGSINHATNLITAAADGDVDEVRILLRSDIKDRVDQNGDKIVNAGDYDNRTALHLAASEGNAAIVMLLVQANANVNAEDRWGGRPLDDAISAGNQECIRILKDNGARESSKIATDHADTSSTRKMLYDNLHVDFEELEMIDRIGAGAFGEIYRCRWRGTMVAAKCIKSAKIRKEWLSKNAMKEIANGANVDDALKLVDEAELEFMENEMALNDFRQEISFLKSLRHPNIVLLLAYSTTENYEVMISELMRCSLLDIFAAHNVHGTRLPKQQQILYAVQLARGMNYLHTCKPPIIHRDLKPANLLLDQNGSLKISDFGLAKIRRNATSDDEYVMTGETGSYRYMAPEVYRHEDYDERVDVYSYAMIFFYLLDGRPPWPSLAGLKAIQRASEMGERPVIPRHWDQVLQSIITQCWDENQASRPRFSTVLASLDAYYDQHYPEQPLSVATVRCAPKCTIM